MNIKLCALCVSRERSERAVNKNGTCKMLDVALLVKASRPQQVENKWVACHHGDSKILLIREAQAL